MAVILGLDIGDKRVGTALSDVGESMATPYETFERGAGSAESKLLKLIADRSIQTVVVGMPLSESGERNDQCEKVEQFARRLERRAQISIKFVDEYGTSFEAEERLSQMGVSAKRAKSERLVDSMAAAIILQQYLDSLENAK